MTSAEISVQIACDDAGGLPAESDMRAWVDLTLTAAAGGGDERYEIALRIVGENEGRTLNRRYRGKDKATNVLSFPAASGDAFAALDDDEPRPLGDLVLCAPIVALEAGEQDKPLASHWGHLLVHGTLHLLGYDHRHESETRRMEALETRILARLGVDDPYREQDSA